MNRSKERGKKILLRLPLIEQASQEGLALTLTDRTIVTTEYGFDLNRSNGESRYDLK